MARRVEIANRFTEAVLKRLLAKKLIDVKNEASVKATIQHLLLENFEAEGRIEAEARKILQDHVKEIKDTPVDYGRLLTMVKGKLAKERGVVL
ncbi:MAG TPA: DUF507 family protein [Methylomirabilota bacterium]|nr:DUF507 family protein [Methylomirabilota bacterium]